MASFFSVDYWKALYFKAMGGQETAVDPNAMRGTFAGTSEFTGTADGDSNAISGSFAGAGAFTGTLSGTQSQVFGGWILDTSEHDEDRRKKKRAELSDLEDIVAKAMRRVEAPTPKAPPAPSIRAIQKRVEQLDLPPAPKPTDDIPDIRNALAEIMAGIEDLRADIARREDEDEDDDLLLMSA